MARCVLARAHRRVPLEPAFWQGKEPFWQQAYTNLVRWIIELYRVLPGGRVTLRDVYHCAIDKDLFARKIKQAQTYAADMSDTRITITATEMAGDHLTALRAFGNRLVARPSRRTKQEVFNLKLQMRVRRYPDRVLDTARLQRLVDRRPRRRRRRPGTTRWPSACWRSISARASPPVVCAGDVARPQLRRHAVTVIVEQKQRVVADRLEVPVVGAAFLLPCTGLLLESLSSTMRSARSNVSTCPIRSRFTAITPPRLSSRVSSSVSTGSRRSTSLPGHCRVITVSGESMEPTLGNGCSILVNLASRRQRVGRLFVVRTDDGLIVKRRRPGRRRRLAAR